MIEFIAYVKNDPFLFGAYCILAVIFLVKLFEWLFSEVFTVNRGIIFAIALFMLGIPVIHDFTPRKLKLSPPPANKIDKNFKPLTREQIKKREKKDKLLEDAKKL